MEGLRYCSVVTLLVGASACELDVYTPTVSVVGDPGTAPDGQSGDDQTPGDSQTPGDTPGDPGSSLPDGSFCTSGTQCLSTICIDDVCCAEACDGTCEECDGTGTCVVSLDDDACGSIDCQLLDSTCRDYDDPTERCASRGVCKAPNSSDCTDFTDLSDVTPCNDDDPGTAPDTCDGAGACVGVPVVLAKVGAFNIGTDPVGTSVPVTGVGFQPKALFLWWSGRTNDTSTVTTATGRMHYRRGFAFSAGPGQSRLVTTQAENSSGSNDADRMYREDAIVSSLTRSRVIDGLAELSSFDADGFTLQVAFDPFDENLAITYLALGGAAITNAAVGTFTSTIGVATGTQEITGVGFQPDAVIFLNGWGTVAPPYDNTTASISIGAATGPALEENAVVASGVPNGSSPPASRGYHLLGECAAVGSGWMTMYERGKLDAFLPDGFRLEWTEVDQDDEFIYFYLAIQGGNPRIGSLLTATNTTDLIPVTGIGYEPASALLFSRCEDEDSPNNSGSRNRVSIGGFSSTASEQWVQAAYNASLSGGDPNPSTRASAALSSENIYFRLSDGGGTSGSMALVSVDSDGFTCQMTDADSNPQRFVWFLTFGPGPP